VEVVASLSQGRTAAAQCGLFTYKSVPVIFDPPCIWSTENTHTKHGIYSHGIGLINLLCGTASINKVWSACGQHTIQYTE